MTAGRADELIGMALIAGEKKNRKVKRMVIVIRDQKRARALTKSMSP